ncbi:MAG: caspase family protein [Bacteroidota bacterium]
MNSRFQCHLVAVFCVLSLTCFAQRGGEVENTSTESAGSGTTYALIVGISDYQNPKITDLNFADVDAIVFQDYLLSVGLPKENVFTLINENATNASFWTMLNFLSQKVNKGDVVYLYFSGHGDVETNTIVQDAFLLPYDSPYSVYSMGAIGMSYLKNWIATFSSKGVQTIFIADACRSGNLIGGKEGMEATANILKDKWKDEIKIVSCQAGELSLEGKQWGGGRGLFSFELINGLSGLADKNKDSQISLRELNLYLLDIVPEQAGAQKQNPVLSGNFETQISSTNASFLRLNKLESDSIQNLKKVLVGASTKSTSEAYLLQSTSRANSNVAKGDEIALFHQFKEQLDKGRLISSDSSNAYFLFLELEKKYSESEFTEVSKLLLSEKIVNDLKAFLDFIISKEKQQHFDEGVGKPIVEVSLEATALRQFIGDQKLKENGQFALVLFGEAIRALSRFSKYDGLVMPKELAVMKLDSALMYDSGAVYVNCLKGFIYEFEFNDKEKAMNEYSNAVIKNPNFFVAKEQLFNNLHSNNDYASIIKYNTNSKKDLNTVVWNYICYTKLKQIDSATVYYGNLLSFVHQPLNHYKEVVNGFYVTEVLEKTQNLEEALVFAKKVEQILQLPNRFVDSTEYQDILNYMNYQFATIYAQLNSKEEALRRLELILLNKDKYDFNWWSEDEDFDNIRNTSKFKSMLKKYAITTD